MIVRVICQDGVIFNKRTPDKPRSIVNDNLSRARRHRRYQFVRPLVPMPKTRPVRRDQCPTQLRENFKDLEVIVRAVLIQAHFVVEPLHDCKNFIKNFFRLVHCRNRLS